MASGEILTYEKWNCPEKILHIYKIFVCVFLFHSFSYIVTLMKERHRENASIEEYSWSVKNVQKHIVDVYFCYILE